LYCLFSAAAYNFIRSGLFPTNSFQDENLPGSHKNLEWNDGRSFHFFPYSSE